MTVCVTQAPYCAAGDGVTPDRAAIQAAIDAVYLSGGGVVEIPAGRTFLTAGLILRTGVELRLGEAAVLAQDPDKSHYVRPAEGISVEPYDIIFGHNYSPVVKWSHTWYKNYPFIFAPEGSHHFALTGRGTLMMMPCDNADDVIHTCPVGFYGASDFRLSDFSIRNYHGYAMMPFTCSRGLIENVDIRDWSFGNGDGICMMNCRDMRVTGCTMYTGDDSLYIFSSYRDPRGGDGCWWSSETPQASENIEIDGNDLASHGCKAFGMILWGADCPDPEKVEVRNVYIHDNRFRTMGNWLYNPYTDNTAVPPVTDVRWENNDIEAIEENFFETPVSGQAGFPSMQRVKNGDFRAGRCYWMTRGDAGAERTDDPYGYVDGGDAALYEGLWLYSGRPVMLKAFVSGRASLFAEDAATGETVAELPFDCAEQTETRLVFTVSADGNYNVGVRGGSARIRDVRLAGSLPNETGYSRIEGNGGKFLFYK